CAAGCFTAQGMGADFAAEAKAGEYLVKVTRQPTPSLEPAGAGEPPESFTKDYLLKVTQ
ncbi:MAG: hypothetical protein H7Y33_00160, partial [Cytophagales bacterium]|nr:hypothetical protein [Rhizobacter sp.]